MIRHPLRCTPQISVCSSDCCRLVLLLLLLPLTRSYPMIGSNKPFTKGVLMAKRCRFNALIHALKGVWHVLDSHFSPQASVLAFLAGLFSFR